MIVCHYNSYLFPPFHFSIFEIILLIIELPLPHFPPFLTKRGKREINFGSFLEPFAGGAGFGLALASGQVDHVQLADADVIFAVVGRSLTALHSHHKYSVRSG